MLGRSTTPTTETHDIRTDKSQRLSSSEKLQFPLGKPPQCRATIHMHSGGSTAHTGFEGLCHEHVLRKAYVWVKPATESGRNEPMDGLQERVTGSRRPMHLPPETLFKLITGSNFEPCLRFFW